MEMRFIYIILLTLITSNCIGQKDAYLFTSFHEPATEGLRLLYSYDGYKWTDCNKIFLKPEVGSKVMRDPSMVQGPDGVFHLVWTSGWNKDRGFGYAHSTDLVHWSQQQFIPVMTDTNTVNVWAPELFYDDEHNQFIIIWASTIPFKFPKGQEEEKNNHRLYYTTTKDFKSFSPAGLFFNPGFSVIDAEIVKRGKADYVLVLKDNTRPNRNLKVAFAKHALGPYTQASDPFTKSFTEGPSAIQAGNDWLIYYDAYQEKKYGAVKTNDFKHFADASGEISIPEGHKHGTIIKTNSAVLTALLKQ
jgi:Glycosyl hydrolases family 43